MEETLPDMRDKIPVQQLMCRRGKLTIISVETGIMWGTKLGAGECDGVGLSKQGFE